MDISELKDKVRMIIINGIWQRPFQKNLAYCKFEETIEDYKISATISYRSIKNKRYLKDLISVVDVIAEAEKDCVMKLPLAKDEIEESYEEFVQEYSQKIEEGSKNAISEC